MMPRQVRAQVLYDNKDISADLAPYMNPFLIRTISPGKRTT